MNWTRIYGISKIPACRGWWERISEKSRIIRIGGFFFLEIKERFHRITRSRFDLIGVEDKRWPSAPSFRPIPKNEFLRPLNNESTTFPNEKERILVRETPDSEFPLFHFLTRRNIYLVDSRKREREKRILPKRLSSIILTKHFTLCENRITLISLF